MNIQLKTLVEAKGALQRLGGEKLPVRQAYTIARNLRKINPELEEHQKKVEELIVQYGELMEDGNSVRVPPGSENFKKFMADVEELGKVEIEVDVRRIKLSEMDIAITPADLALMDFMFEDD